MMKVKAPVEVEYAFFYGGPHHIVPAPYHDLNIKQCLINLFLHRWEAYENSKIQSFFHSLQTTVCFSLFFKLDFPFWHAS